MASSLVRTEYIEVDCGRIAFDDTGGPGHIVLCIPGMGDLRSEYRLLWPTLQQAGFRVVTMDIRGFGETSAKWADYSARSVGSDAISIVERLDAGPASIIGNSFAAGSALWAARERPDLVSSVVLLGPVIRDLPLTRIQKFVLAIGFAGPWRTWFWTTYWSSLFPTKRASDHDVIKSAIARNLRAPGRMPALLTMLSLSKADTTAILDDSTVRSLVVMGTKDPDFKNPVEEAQKLATQLHAKTIFVEGAGHYPHVEMADQVAPQIVSFLESFQLAPTPAGVT